MGRALSSLVRKQFGYSSNRQPSFCRDKKPKTNLLPGDCFRQLLKISVALRRLDVCNEDNTIQPAGE